MKKQIIGTITALAMAFGTTALVGCGGEHSHEGHEEEGHEHHAEETNDHADHEHAHYACPMDCEGGKVYDEPGQCPECNMDMVEVEEEAESDAEAIHDHEHTYSCPMHPEITGHDGDKCSKCGMDLEKVEE